MKRSEQLKLMEAFWEELTPIYPQNEADPVRSQEKSDQQKQEHQNWEASKHLLHKRDDSD